MVMYVNFNYPYTCVRTFILNELVNLFQQIFFSVWNRFPISSTFSLEQYFGYLRLFKIKGYYVIFISAGLNIAVMNLCEQIQNQKMTSGVQSINSVPMFDAKPTSPN